MIHIPPYLVKGDTIGIVCPAGFMPAAKAQTCINTLHAWGFKTKVGKTLGHQFNYFSGTDEERLEDLQQMLDDTTIKAILCGRGGYGLSRIVDALDFSRFTRSPKWIIGYSDITLLHAHLYTVCKTAALHAPMAAAFNDGGASTVFVQSLKKALTGKPANYACAPHTLNRPGMVSGRLLGGNLSLLAHTLGSASEVDTKNSILFLEDVGEYLYNTDRLFMQLKRAGKLDKLAGLVLGSFSDMKDTTIPFGQTVQELILDKVKEYAYPVCFNFPVGHAESNYALKTGVSHTLSVTNRKVVLKEI